MIPSLKLAIFCEAGEMASHPDIHHLALLNPLGASLAHYTISLEHLLSRSGTSVSVFSTLEPSASGKGQIWWLIEYVRLLLSTRRRADDLVIITWPVLGYWDFVIARMLLSSKSLVKIVMHDPRPLVRATGYTRLARWCASRSSNGPSAIVHSKAAGEILQEDTSLPSVRVLPHPMLPPLPSTGPLDEVVVRVLGMYKIDRDIESLRLIASCGPSDWRYEIVGRGWPTVPGWHVDDRFVDEDEFDDLIRTSSVILIPYKRFFQSGVAVRSLELGTPVVGPKESSLSSLLEEKGAWLVTDDGWLDSIRAAAKAPRQDVHQVALSSYGLALASWSKWLVALT